MTAISLFFVCLQPNRFGMFVTAGVRCTPCMSFVICRCNTLLLSCVVFHCVFVLCMQTVAFFLAQLFLAIAAPLLFSRVLFLAQIDENLGLMVQVNPFRLLSFSLIPHLCHVCCFEVSVVG